jgi:hypothetical protein
MELSRQESVKIVLRRGGRFIARNVCLRGGQTFVVEEGKKIEIK